MSIKRNLKGYKIRKLLFSNKTKINQQLDLKSNEKEMTIK